MSELYPNEEKPGGPLWFRLLPRPIQYLLFVRALEKLLKDPETPNRIYMSAQAYEEGMRILQGKEETSMSSDKSALVALTERQILWLKKVLAEMARKTHELGYKKWDGMPLQDIDRIVEQMRVAAYALQEEEPR